MKKAIIYDTATNSYVELPEGDFELSLGRASSNDIPVPIHSDRGNKKLGEILGNMDSRLGRYLESVCRTVSAENHATLSRDFGDIYIEDNESTSGTKIKNQKALNESKFGGTHNEHRLVPNKRCRISDFDVFCLGDYRLQVLEIGECDPRMFGLGKQNRYAIKPKQKEE